MYDEELCKLKASDPLLEWHLTHQEVLEMVLENLAIPREVAATSVKEKEQKNKKQSP